MRGEADKSWTRPEARVEQTRTGAAPEIAGPRSALKGQSVQWEGRTLLPGASPGRFSAVCCRPVALQTSEDSAGTLGLAFASRGQNALSVMLASAIQAAMRLRERCAIMTAFLAQMRAFCQPRALQRFWYSSLRYERKAGSPAPAHRAGEIHLRLEFSESGLLLVPALGPRARRDRFHRRRRRCESPRGARRAHRQGRGRSRLQVDPDQPRGQGPVRRAAQETAAPGARAREGPPRRRVRRLRGRGVARARAGRSRTDRGRIPRAARGDRR